MSRLINYIYDLIITKNDITHEKLYHVTEEIDNGYSLINKKYLITREDLESVNLKELKNVVPNPSRNMPLIDINRLKELNKAQSNIILNVKLKPIPFINKNKTYEPRHPVLKEMMSKVKCVQ